MEKQYRTIVADPPWRYNVIRANGAAENHYPTMSTAEMCALPVPEWAAPDCLLLMWATWPKLQDAMQVIDAWGFEYISGFPWIKIEGEPQRTFWGEYEYRPQWGIGFWVRGCSELLLICRRGKVSPPGGEHIGLISRNFQHSRKPENLYEYAEQFSGPYLEMFARRARPGWDLFGNEVDSAVAVDGAA